MLEDRTWPAVAVAGTVKIDPLLPFGLYFDGPV